ncbi:MAG: twin-arginine translocase TatA/TatE family subunit [Mariprofundaceae bacterium]
MPDIGLFELILIGALAFVVLGPERLPEFFGQIGRMLRHARMWVGELKHQWQQETREVRGDVDKVHDAVSGSISTIEDAAPDSDTDAAKPK